MQPRHASRRRVPGRTGPGRWVAGALLGTAIVVVSAIVWSAVAGPGASVDGAVEAPPAASPVHAAAPVEPVVPTETASGDVVRASSVLTSWDRARAAAWRRGSVGALRRLYAEGVGASDVRLLKSYLSRGLRVHGIRMQLLAVEVLARRPGEWRLRVTDRLAGAVAVGHGAGEALPRDRASTRSIRLVRIGERWRVASVRQVP